MKVDLRSDTVTTPTPGMLRAMTEAETGDDVFGEDPTVNAFQERMADLFGFEAGLFVPSGVMGNQVCLKLLTRPGEEVIIDRTGHVFNYENSSAALISSVQLHPVEGRRGKISGPLIRAAMRSGRDWEPVSSAVVIENTTNKGGGACYDRSELVEIRDTARELGLKVHLDGARIWNAVTAREIPPSFYGSVADTMTVSFSKGLGAPVGSMVLGSREAMKEARRYRKMLGGGMRQIGLLAAAADYAVRNHLPLLEEDHRRAGELAGTAARCERLEIDPSTVETNIVIFRLKEGGAEEAIEELKSRGVLMVPFGPETVRATFHFQVDDAALEHSRKTLKELFA